MLRRPTVRQQRRNRDDDCNNIRGNVFWDLVARFAGWMTGRQIDRALAKIA
jgi:hypothetical protein